MKTTILLLLIFLIFSGCTSKTEVSPESVQRFVIEAVFGRTEQIYLKNKNYDLFVDTKKYGLDVVGDYEIKGFVQKDTFFFNSEKVNIYLSPKNYGLTPKVFFKETPARNFRFNLPDISNQNTKNELLDKDLLVGRYQGIFSKILQYIKFDHANALLHFTILDHNENDKVLINDLTEDFIPYNFHSNEFYGIITGDWISKEVSGGYIDNIPKAYIIVKNGNNSMRVDLPEKIFPIKSGEKINFNLRIDKVKNLVNVEDIKKSRWLEDLNLD